MHTYSLEALDRVSFMLEQTRHSSDCFNPFNQNDIAHFIIC